MNNIESNYDRGFFQCSGLKKVSATKIKNLGTYSFYLCRGLHNVQLGSKNNPVESIDSTSFASCNQADGPIIEIYIDTTNGAKSLVNEPWGATNSTIKYYSAQDGNLVDVILGTQYKGDATLDITELPDESKITRIRAEAFNGCSSIKLTRIPAGVTALEGKTFYNCNGLVEMNLQNVESCDNRDLFQCRNLETVIAPKVKTLGLYTLYNCRKLKTVELGSQYNPVQSIHTQAFDACTQNDLTIKVYIAHGTSSLANEPWGATNATIEYYDAETDTKIN